MEHNRIKKLLLSEYREFSDKILVESPFAQTTRDGRGLREVALGLTPSKLIIATDVFKNKLEYVCPQNLDPSIESFELISVYPLEYINLSIFRRRRRKTLKARFVNGKANYYELGGMLRRNLLWKQWCHHIQTLLSQRENGSSLSETTAASSSSTSTLYFLSSDVESEADGNKKKKRGDCRVWAHYGAEIPPVWSKKDVYLGPSYNELSSGHYSPIPIRFAGASLEDIRFELIPTDSICKISDHSWPNDTKSRRNRRIQRSGLCNVLFIRESYEKRERNSSTSGSNISRDSLEDCCGDNIHTNHSDHMKSSLRSSVKSKNHKFNIEATPSESSDILVPKLSRFGFGVDENCSSGLYLQPYDCDPDHLVRVKSAYKLMDPYKLIESGVSIWEKGSRKSSKLTNSTEHSSRHFRRYGLATAPHFLHALGPWSVYCGDKISIQSRRSSSLVTIRKQPMEPELRLPVSKRQLSGSISMTSLESSLSSSSSSSSFSTPTRGKVILFWTPEYWYRPRAAAVAYQELRQHLKLLHDYHVDRTNLKEKKNSSKKNFFGKKNKYYVNGKLEEMKNSDKSSSLLNKIFTVKNLKRKDNIVTMEDKSISQLRRLLKLNLRITAWDLDSTTIAKQLTLIDRDLFLRIPPSEIKIIIREKTSRNAPNVGAWIAFSHRVSCLISSEILSMKKLDMRARILVRFINAANKCYSMGNFHSCRSILAGLQSPPIYRLKIMWGYIKIHHATRYETMGKLCRIFQTLRTKIYKKAWDKTEYGPSIPYVGDLLIRTLGIDEEDDGECLFKNIPRKWDQKNYDSASTFLHQSSDSKISRGKCMQRLSSVKKIENSERKDTERCFVKRIFSRIISGKTSCSNRLEKDFHWASRQLILARKFYDRWQMIVLTSRIIKEEENKKKNIDPKQKRAEKVATWLVRCQNLAQGYEFPGHSVAWEFLLKARYKEDRENFFFSKNLES